MPFSDPAKPEIPGTPSIPPAAPRPGPLRGCGLPGAARDRNPDGGVGHPAGLLLRHHRLQADLGTISRTGILPQSPPLDPVGGYARTINDVALLVDAISAFDPRDGDMTSSPKPSLTAAVANPLDRPPRFAFIKSPPGRRRTSARNGRSKPMRVASAPARKSWLSTCPPTSMVRCICSRSCNFQILPRTSEPIADKNPNSVSQKLKDVIAEGRSFSSADIAAARAERDPLYDALQPVLINYDAILTPAAPGPAPEGLASTGSPAFNALWTFLGMPCISLPLLEVAGLPLGVQLVAARGDDASLAAHCQVADGAGADVR